MKNLQLHEKGHTHTHTQNIIITMALLPPILRSWVQNPQGLTNQSKTNRNNNNNNKNHDDDYDHLILFYHQHPQKVLLLLFFFYK